MPGHRIETPATRRDIQAKYDSFDESLRKFRREFTASIQHSVWRIPRFDEPPRLIGQCWRCASFCEDYSQPPRLGICFLDEIIARMHPRWKLVIGESDLCSKCWDGLPLILMQWQSDTIQRPEYAKAPPELLDPRRVIPVTDTSFIIRPKLRSTKYMPEFFTRALYGIDYARRVPHDWTVQYQCIPMQHDENEEESRRWTNRPFRKSEDPSSSTSRST